MDTDLKEAERNFLTSPEDPVAGHKFRSVLVKLSL